MNPLPLVLVYLAGLSASLVLNRPVTPWFAGAALPLLLAWLLLSKRKDVRYQLFLVLALLGLFIGSARLQMLDESYLAGLAGKSVSAVVTVTSPPEARGEKMVFTGRVSRVTRGQSAVTLKEDTQVEIVCRDGCPPEMSALSEGSMLEARASLSEPRSTPDADFDYSLYLRRRGINSVLRAEARQVRVLPERRGGIAGFIDSLRGYARETLGGDWGEAGNLLQGMVLGDDHVVAEGIIEDFRASGLLHMLAVSGQNVVLLGFIVLLITRALMVPKLAATVIAVLVICIYVPLTGSGPSIVRAGVVGVLGLMALLFSRQTDRCHFLALAAAVIMSLNPFSLLDPGFQLSFAAVLAIFFIAPPLASLLSFMPAALREAVAISTATGLATAPITLANFHQVSIVTVPANVAAAPVAGAVMLLGVLAVLARPLLPLLSWVLVAGASVCTGYLIQVARIFASFPGAVYNGGAPGVLPIGAFYLLLAGAAATHRNGSLRRLADRLNSRRVLALPVLLLLAIAAAWIGLSDRGPETAAPDVFTVSFLDVGQGDAALIQGPPEEAAPTGYTLMIDGGPGSQVLDRLKECGVTRIDAVFLSHPDADHLSGLLPVLESYPVGIVYDAVPEGGGAQYREFLKIMERKGIDHQAVVRGQTMSFGELRIEIVNPGPAPRPDDTNANSVVLLAGYHGLDILFPGDAEGDVLASLELEPAEIYKVPHHGSSDSSIRQVLTGLDPEIAVISVGTGNSYGHPAAQTLDALRASGAGVFRTDLQGTVRASFIDGEISISTQK